MTAIKMDTPTIMMHLRAAHPPDKWFFWEEIKVGGGFGRDSMQRFDAVAIHYLPSKKNTVRCYEVKASKSDFLREIHTPKKRRAGLRLSNEFWFITPQGLVSIDEIPTECGLLEVLADGTLKEIVHAPYRESIPTWNFVASILRSLDRERLKEWKEIQWYIDRDKALEYASLKILKKRISEFENYKFGNKEVPDKIAEQLRLTYNEILDTVNNRLLDGEDE